MATYIELGGSSFNVATIKKMSWKQFNETYRGKLRGVDIKEAYEKITGKKLKKK